jgi:hypothetical protein
MMKSKNNQIRKSSMILTITASLLIYANVSKAQKADFSGTWKVNKETSDPGSLSINSIPLLLKVKQAGNDLQVTRISTNSRSEMRTDSDTLKLDGTTNDRSLPGNQQKHSSAKWADDGKSLMETASYTDAQGKPLHSLKKIWSLSADGKILHIAVDMTVNEETNRLEEYFDRQ